jgi:NitT/TauT family transport system ATP-binding protein
VFQSPRLAPWRSAIGNVLLGMKLRRVAGTRAEHRARAEKALDAIGIRALANRRAHALSGGEQQRVSIARALAVSPEVLLMDEPFSALDVQTRRRMRREIVDLWRRTGLTIVLVTHDIEEALEVASRVVVFSPKPTSVLADKTVDLEHPRDRRTEEFRRLHDDLVALFEDPDALDGSPA